MKRWETPIEAALKREGLEPDAVGKIMAIIHKKKLMWELDAMKSILEMRSKQNAESL
jgi:cobalamin biosynthesis protein CbiG